MFELLPPTFLLSDGRHIDGEYMIDASWSARAAGNLEQITDAMKMEAQRQILLDGKNGDR